MPISVLVRPLKFMASKFSVRKTQRNRVSLQKLETNANGQGYGAEYLGTDGVWYHTSTLKPQNPSYNAEAAANTHIPVS